MTIQEVLARHQRRDIKGCSCGGWGVDHGDIGKSHPDHVIAELKKAGYGIVRIE